MRCCLSLFLYIYAFVELICTLWAYFPCQNQFLNDFIVLIDLENVGVVTSFARFGHDFTKLCLKNGFCSQVMCKNLSDPKYPTRTFFDPTRPVRKSWPVAPQRLHNCGTNCIQWGYFHWPYQFLIAFLYLDTDIFVNELVRFVHVLTKLCLKTEFCIMTDLFA